MKSKKGFESFSLGREDSVEIGHTSAQALSPKDEALFKAFQSNLLSLISHELRTPLMGIQNALTILDAEKENPQFSPTEWIGMAMQNVQRLNQALSGLLDRAAVDSQTFRANLREVDLQRLVEHWITENDPLLRSKQLSLEWLKGERRGGAPLLADPHKLTRALDLCAESLLSKVKPGSPFKLRISNNRVEIYFTLLSEFVSVWTSNWSASLVGLHSGLLSPHSAFAGVLQSEEAFLTRSEEGLGGELLLVHEIMKVHRGQFSCHQEGNSVQLALQFSELPALDLLHVVLSTRVEHLESELGSVALILWQVDSAHSLVEWMERVQRSLYRTTDAVYPLPERHQLAIVVNHCKTEYLTHIIDRILASVDREDLGEGVPEKPAVGIAHCPEDGYDPHSLITLAEKRLACFDKLRYASRLNS